MCFIKNRFDHIVACVVFFSGMYLTSVKWHSSLTNPNFCPLYYIVVFIIFSQLDFKILFTADLVMYCLCQFLCKFVGTGFQYELPRIIFGYYCYRLIPMDATQPTNQFEQNDETVA
jgi:hypothetical protein